MSHCLVSRFPIVDLLCRIVVPAFRGPLYDLKTRGAMLTPEQKLWEHLHLPDMGLTTPGPGLNTRS